MGGRAASQGDNEAPTKPSASGFVRSCVTWGADVCILWKDVRGGWMLVDHIIYAAPDLDSAVDDLETRLGVRAAGGGQHIGQGTHNKLLALGPRRISKSLRRIPANRIRGPLARMESTV